jgi:hypothetical protein
LTAFDVNDLNISGGVSVHNDLTGLQGGTTDEYYHITQAQSGGDWSDSEFGVSNLIIGGGDSYFYDADDGGASQIYNVLYYTGVGDIFELLGSVGLGAWGIYGDAIYINGQTGTINDLDDIVVLDAVNRELDDVSGNTVCNFSSDMDCSGVDVKAESIIYSNYNNALNWDTNVSVRNAVRLNEWDYETYFNDLSYPVLFSSPAVVIGDTSISQSARVVTAVTSTTGGTLGADAYFGTAGGLPTCSGFNWNCVYYCPLYLKYFKTRARFVDINSVRIGVGDIFSGNIGVDFSGTSHYGAMFYADVNNQNQGVWKGIIKESAQSNCFQANIPIDKNWHIFEIESYEYDTGGFNTISSGFKFYIDGVLASDLNSSCVDAFTWSCGNTGSNFNGVWLENTLANTADKMVMDFITWERFRNNQERLK